MTDVDMVDREPGEPWSGRPRASLADAEHRVERSLGPHRLRTDADVPVTYRPRDVGRLGLHDLDYRASATVLPLERAAPYFLVHIPLRGSMGMRRGRLHLDCQPGSALVHLVGGGGADELTFSQDCPRLLIKIPRLLLHDRAEQLGAGRTVASAFTGAVLDVRDGAVASWYALLRNCVRDVDADDGLFRHDRTGRYFESLIVDGLLIAAAELRPEPPVRSRVVHAATGYVLDHLADDITAADVARSAHVSVRTLQEEFRRALGTTPMQYLRDARLDAVHRDLRDGGAGVSDVCSRWGVTHAGRFAAAYRLRFGVSPSDTLRAGADRTDR